MINIQLDPKPLSISIRYNGYYKLVLLLAIIKYCGIGQKASLELVHIVFWSLRSETNYQVLDDLSKQVRKNLIPWTFEHGIEEVLSLGFVNAFIERIIVTNTLEIKITEKGIQILKSIQEFQLFQEELSKISSLGKIPKSRLQSANKSWSII